MDAVVMIRLVLLFAAGLVIGGQVNRGIYRFAWDQRSIGPWSPPDPSAPARRWWDRVPLVGWFFLRREAELHGRLFWLRPLFIELVLGAGLAALYWYEVDQATIARFGGAFAPPPSATLHAQYLAHAVLIALMLVATFIDFDEQTIPDAITIPGVVVGLAFAAVLPAARLLVTLPAPFDPVSALHLGSGTGWPNRLNGYQGLILGWLGFGCWWLAVLPWTWTMRRGFMNAVRYFVASLLRRTRPRMVGLAIAGCLTTTICWWLGGATWESYFSAINGMVCGGGFVWSFRIVGTRALGQEAMGFGDVTLMAMIGSFLGWQATLMIFFLAPAAAVVISIVQWILTGNKVIAFGPYLCLATLFAILRWDWLWENYARPIFSLGWFVPALMVTCVAMTWALLTLMRFVRETVGGSR